MDRIRTFLILALTLPLIGAITVGCNTGTEEPAAPNTDATDAASETTASPEMAEPPVPVTPEDIHPSRFPDVPEGANAAIPSNYPSDLPIYPGAVPALGRGQSGEGSETAGLQLLTNDDPDKAYGYYRDELESKGWSVVAGEAASGAGEQSSIAATKDGCKAIVMFVPSESGGGTDIFSMSSCDDDV